MRVTKSATVPFGRGIDRATGDLAVDGGSLEVASNLVLREKKYQVRWGIGDPVADLTTIYDTEDPPVAQPSNVVCHVFHYRALGKICYIGYETSTGKVRLYKGNLVGSGIEFVLLLDTLAADLPEPPLFKTCESDSIVLIAHDEPDGASRMSTYYWDGLNATPANQIPAVLTGNLDGAGSNPIKFRGVQTYKNWVFGWGYGTNTDPLRPELLRVSMPGDPQTWDPNHYFVVGVRDDAILSCETGTNVFVIFKGGSWFRIVGTDRSNWSVEQGGSQFGVSFSRSTLSINGVVYFWSDEGPRVTTGLEPSRDLSQKLDIDAPPVFGSDLQVNRNLGWTVYVPQHRQIWWGFPGETTTGVLSLSTRDTEEAVNRWSSQVIGAQILSVCTKDPSPPASNPSPGTVATISSDMIVGYHATDPWNATPGVSNELNLSWTYASDVIGDEIVEVWFSVDGGAYAKYTEYQLTNTTGQGYRYPNLSNFLWSNTSLAVALRLRRRGGYATGYTSTNPADWPSAAKHTVNPFFCTELTSTAFTNIRPDPEWFAVTYPYPGWTATNGWAVTATVGKAAYTRPTQVDQVLLRFNQPYNGTYNDASLGKTWASTLPVRWTIDYTMTAGGGNDDGATTVVQNWRHAFQAAVSYGGQHGYFDGSSFALSFRYTSSIASTVTSYLGKGSPKTRLALFVNEANMTTPPGGSAPVLKSPGIINGWDYAYYTEDNTFWQMKVPLTDSTVLQQIAWAAAPGDPGYDDVVSAQPVLGCQPFRAYTACVMSDTQIGNYVYCYNTLYTSNQPYPFDQNMKTSGGTLWWKFGYRKMYHYTWLEWKDEYQEYYEVFQVTYYGPIVDYVYVDTGITASSIGAPDNADPYTPWNF